MRIHDDWSTSAFDLAPAAADTGPFPMRPFLEIWWRMRGSGEPLLVESEEGLLPLWRGPTGVEVMGEPDLTDYHSPLGSGVAELAAGLVGELPAGTRFRLDSLPAEVADPLATGLRAAGRDVGVRRHDTAAVLDLPGSYEDYVGGLGSKDRHELRRKGRRFAAALGEPRLVRDSSPAAFASFLAMHRSAEGDKGEFMTPDMESFFGALLDLAGTRLDLLMGETGAPIAAAFGFEVNGGYYLYNSAYDPAAARTSPGLILVDRLIADSITARFGRFDFMKGDESYKFRLGARVRPLYLLEGEL